MEASMRANPHLRLFVGQDRRERRGGGFGGFPGTAQSGGNALISAAALYASYCFFFPFARSRRGCMSGRSGGSSNWIVGLDARPNQGEFMKPHVERSSFALGTLLALLVAIVNMACDSKPTPLDNATVERGEETATNDSEGRLVTYTESRTPCDHYTEERLPFFGDLHVHTNLSFDASAISIGATPADAYNYARGQAIDFWPIQDGKPGGTFAIDRPLDFLAVTDHGEFLGEQRICRDPEATGYDADFCKRSRASQDGARSLLALTLTSENPTRIAELCGKDGRSCREYAKDPWQEIGAAADAAYDRSARCQFTALKGYEYTGLPETSNYHRNVIFRNGNVPEFPVSYIDAPYDSALWEQLDAACTEEAGCSYLTIPHNTNLSNGRMAPYMRLAPTITNRRAYATKRLEREPVMEIFQHKGASECINGLTSILGEADELCNFEAVRFMGREEVFTVSSINENGQVERSTAREATRECEGGVGSYGMLGVGCVDPTDFHRSALLVGLSEANQIGLNSIKLGVIASTDTHAATPGAVDEADWRGHIYVESTPAERLRPGMLTSGIDGNPGGLAGVWAVENSRDAIFEAILRRETFGTSGPRITPRFFAGWDYSPDLCESSGLVAAGYKSGVPMGGDLPPAPKVDAKPVFVASAMRDPSAMGAPLQQLQLVKGWIDGDEQKQTEVIVIAGGPNEAHVDVATGERIGAGHDTLCAVYRDDDFQLDQSTYYYLRVVENPSARWSTYDCQRIAANERPAVCSDNSYPETIQEMAWTSPIWHQR
jgi:Protein of unknown function (DUF3604)